MTGIIPTSANGGVEVRDATGTCLSPIGVSNAYCPNAEFTSSCPINYLPDGCTARITPAQLNAIESELLCLAETFNPDGNWNCGALCNIGSAFTAWMTETTAGTLYKVMQTQACAMPNTTHAAAIAFTDPRVILCDGLGNLHKLSYQLASSTAIGVVQLAEDADIAANVLTTAVTAGQLNVRTPCGAPAATLAELAAMTGTESILTCIGGVNKTVPFDKVADFVVTGTDLGYVPSPLNGTITSNTGTDAIIPLWDTTNAGLVQKAGPVEMQDYNKPLGTAFGPSPVVNLDDVKGITSQDFLELIRLNHVVKNPLTINIGPDFPTVRDALLYLQDRDLKASVVINVPAGVTTETGVWPRHDQWQRISIVGAPAGVWPSKNAFSWTGFSPFNIATDMASDKTALTATLPSRLVFPVNSLLSIDANGGYGLLSNLMLENVGLVYDGISCNQALTNIAIFSDDVALNARSCTIQTVDLYAFGAGAIGIVTDNSKIRNNDLHYARGGVFGLVSGGLSNVHVTVPAEGAGFRASLIACLMDRGSIMFVDNFGASEAEFHAEDQFGGPIRTETGKFIFNGVVDSVTRFRSSTPNCNVKISINGELIFNGNLQTTIVDVVGAYGIESTIGGLVKLNGSIQVNGPATAACRLSNGSKIQFADASTFSTTSPLGVDIVNGGSDLVKGGTIVTSNVVDNTIDANMNRVSA